MTKHTVKTPVAGAATLGATLFGAVVGGAAAAAGAVSKVKSGEMDKREAAIEVAREAGTTGVATGTAVAVVGALGLGGLLSFAGMVVVATGTKYALDSVLKPAPEVPAIVPAAKKVKAVPKKKTAARKKVASKGTAKKKADDVKTEAKASKKIQ